MASRRRRLLAVVAVIATPLVVFELAVRCGDFPAADLAAPAGSTRLLDRHGALLREAVDTHGARARWAPLSRMSPLLVAATIAVEDARFLRHGGIDGVGVLRAIADNLRAGRIVSGASTLTMQLARLIHPHAEQRSFGGKLREAVDARRLERQLDKSALLEQYLNRAPYGPALLGAETASRRYFGKPAHTLDLAEAALLAGLPKAPSALDPLRHPARARARRNHVLGRLLALGWIDAQAYRSAVRRPLALRRPRGVDVDALHVTDWALSRLRRRSQRGGTFVTTVDASLQRDVSGLVREHLANLSAAGATNAAVVVLDNDACQVRALVGSAGYFRGQDGAVNGALARRQPGSALKPFTYGLAFEAGRGPASVIADLEVTYPDHNGRVFAPRNYTGDFSGPVLLGDALGRSLNVPAVRVAYEVGVRKLLHRLRALGFRSLDRPASHYGLGLTLGSGEVTLLELAQGYAALARGGRGCRARLLADGGVDASVSPALVNVSPAQADDEVYSQQVAFLLTQVLSNENLRLEAFGPTNALMLGFPVAVKTGTSTDFRDNWAIGYTARHTVAVWVGDFAGHSLSQLSGATGAGPLFHRVMKQVVAASGEKPERPRPPAGVVETTVCALSGHRPGPHCPQQRSVYSELRTLPKTVCPWHHAIALDRRNGLRAGPRCPERFVEEKAFTELPAAYAAWQALRGETTAPTIYSPFCPAAGAGKGALAIVNPKPGEVYLVEPGYDPRTQSLELRALADKPVAKVEWRIDGRKIASARWPYSSSWSLSKGRHVLTVAAAGQRGDRLEFEVR